MREIKTITAKDMAWFHKLNEACTPEVGSVSLARLQHLVDMAAHAVYLEDESGPLGAMIILSADAAYDSPNFLWFKERYDDFLYLDRIMVAETARGQGVGMALHSAFFEFSAGKAARLACEVNEKPPNPISLAFHERSGFRIVGRLESDKGEKAVQMMVKEL